MLGAVAGDIIGSPYVRNSDDINMDFPLFSEKSKNTEITVMTLAVSEALMHVMPVYGEINFTEERFARELIFWMQMFGRKFAKKVHYGKKFFRWINSSKPLPYESLSNGPALRVSPVAWAFDNIEDVERFAEISARLTSTTDESVLYAQVMAGAVFLARMKRDKEDIQTYFHEKTGLIPKTFDELRSDFYFMTTCKETVSAALSVFLESENFEDAVRKSVLLGGETNATAAMSGAVSEAFSGIKILTEVEAFERLEKRLKFSVEKWEQWISLEAANKNNNL